MYVYSVIDATELSSCKRKRKIDDRHIHRVRERLYGVKDVTFCSVLFSICCCWMARMPHAIRWHGEDERQSEWRDTESERANRIEFCVSFSPFEWQNRSLRAAMRRFTLCTHVSIEIRKYATETATTANAATAAAAPLAAVAAASYLFSSWIWFKW